MTHYVFGTPYDYPGNASVADLNGVISPTPRQRYSNGSQDEQTARVIAVLDEVFHLLEQNHDFFEDVGAIDPFKYRWQVKPHWAEQKRRDILIAKIDAEFVEEMAANNPNPTTGMRSIIHWPAGPHGIWQRAGITTEPSFWRLDFYGRLALCMKLDKALADAARPKQEEPVDHNYPSSW